MESTTFTENIKDIDSVSDSIPVTVIPVVVYGTLNEVLSTFTEIFWTDEVIEDVEVSFDSVTSESLDEFGKL